MNLFEIAVTCFVLVLMLYAMGLQAFVFMMNRRQKELFGATISATIKLFDKADHLEKAHTAMAARVEYLENQVLRAERRVS
jgi:ABC-type Na+ efflux pump permease subunit